jgi:3-dehydroquinate synthase
LPNCGKGFNSKLANRTEFKDSKLAANPTYISITGALNSSKVLFGQGLDQLPAFIPAGRTVIITDTNVGRLYGTRFPKAPVITIGTGEGHKTLATVQEIYKALLEFEVDRSWTVVGIGGGIVCDVTGFAASTYLRGLSFGFVASTLLAQVDASVGGKNGVNFKAYKNMVGLFRQPDFVLCDLEMLKTLPRAELASGFAEIVKHAAIADEAYFDFIEANAETALALDPAVLAHLVRRSVQIKAAVVAKDEHESGERRKLNFGHTIGHAIEKISGISHGHAVSIGMVLAARLSQDQTALPAAETARLTALLERLKLPVGSALDQTQVLKALAKDKKRQQAHIHFVCLERIGRAVVQNIPLMSLETTIGALLSD